MLKEIAHLGNVLTKLEKKSIQGGFVPIVEDGCEDLKRPPKCPAGQNWDWDECTCSGC